MTKFSGGCHCGKVRFEVEADIKQLLSCNCSICTKKGQLLTFVGQDSFALKQGEGELCDYQFHKKKIHHLFCKTCGISSFGRGTAPDGKAMYAVNARCLDDIDLTQFPIHQVDGKSF